MSNNQITILGKEIKKGESAFLELEVAKLHTRNSIKIPIIVESGKHEGPTLLLMGGIHGDEINGVAIVRDIIRKKYNKPDRGIIVCIPVFNIFGYLNMSREFPDGRDLNRIFPGSDKGSLASQFASKFTKEVAPYVDYVLDFHAGGADRENYPNVRCDLSQEDSLQLARVFGAPFIVNSPFIPKSVRHTLNKLGKTTLLFEGGKSNNLDQSVIDIGVEGALNVIKHLGLRKGKIKSKYNPVIISESTWIRAPYSGMFQFKVKNGMKAYKGIIIGRISDPFGEFNKNIVAPYDCYIYGINTAPVVHKGDAIFHISRETV